MSQVDHKTPSRRLIPKPKVASDRYKKTVRTIDLWVATPSMGFPKPIKIRGRAYFYEDELDAFEQRILASGASREAA